MSWFKRKKGSKEFEFKLGFHAERCPPSGWDKLFVSLTKQGHSSASEKTPKAQVRGGVCQWRDPVLLKTHLERDEKTGLFKDKLLKIGIHGSKGSLGEAVLNLSEFVMSPLPEKRILPLQNCSFGTSVNVAIQASCQGGREDISRAITEEVPSEPETDETLSMASLSSAEAHSGPVPPSRLAKEPAPGLESSLAPAGPPKAAGITYSPALSTSAAGPPAFVQLKGVPVADAATAPVAPVAQTTTETSSLATTWGATSLSPGVSAESAFSPPTTLPSPGTGYPATLGTPAFSQPSPGAAFPTRERPLTPTMAPGTLGAETAALSSMGLLLGASDHGEVEAALSQQASRRAGPPEEAGVDAFSLYPQHVDARLYGAQEEGPVEYTEVLGYGAAALAPSAIIEARAEVAALVAQLDKADQKIDGLQSETISWQRSARKYSLEVEAMRIELAHAHKDMDEADMEREALKRQQADLEAELAKLRQRSSDIEAREDQEAMALYQAQEAQRSMQELMQEVKQQKEQIHILNVQLTKLQDSNRILTEALKESEASEQERGRQLEAMGVELPHDQEGGPSAPLESTMGGGVQWWRSQMESLQAEKEALGKLRDTEARSQPQAVPARGWRNAVSPPRAIEESGSTEGLLASLSGWSEEQLKRRIVELETEAEELTDESLQLAEDLTKANAEKTAKDEALEELQAQLAQAKEGVAAVGGALPGQPSATLASTGDGEELALLRDQHAELQKQVAAMTEEARSQTFARTEAVSRFEMEQAELVTTKAALEEAMRKAQELDLLLAKEQAETAVVSGKVEQLQARMDTLLQEHANLDQERVSLVKVLEGRASEVDAMRQRSEELQCALSESEARLEATKDEAAATRAAVAAQVQARVEELEMQVSELSKAKGLAGAYVAEVEAAKKALEEQRGAEAMKYAEEAREREACIEQLTTEVNELKRKLEIMAGEKQDKEDALGEAIKAKARDETALADLAKKLEAAEEEVARVRSALEKAGEDSGAAALEAALRIKMLMQEAGSLKEEVKVVETKLLDAEGQAKQSGEEAARLARELDTAATSLANVEKALNEARTERQAEAAKMAEEREREVQSVLAELALVKVASAKEREVEMEKWGREALVWEEKVATAEGRAREIDLKLAEVTGEVQGHVKAAEQKEEAAKELGRQVAALTAELKDVAARLQEAEGKQQESSARAAQLQERIRSLNQDVEKAKVLHEETRRALEATRADHLRDAARATELAAQVGTLQKDMSEARAQAERQRLEGESMRRKLEEERDSHNKMGALAQLLEGQVAALSGQITEHVNTKREIEQRAMELHAAKVDLEKAGRAKDERLAQLQKEKAAESTRLVSELEQLTSGMEEKTRSANEAVLAAVALRSEKARLEEQLAGAGVVSDQLRARATAVEEELKAVQQAALATEARATRQVAAASKKSDAELEGARQEVMKAKEALKQVNAECDVLRQELVEAKSKAGRMEQNLMESSRAVKEADSLREAAMAALEQARTGATGALEQWEGKVAGLADALKRREEDVRVLEKEKREAVTQVEEAVAAAVALKDREAELSRIMEKLGREKDEATRKEEAVLQRLAAAEKGAKEAEVAHKTTIAEQNERLKLYVNARNEVEELQGKVAELQAALNKELGRKQSTTTRGVHERQAESLETEAGRQVEEVQEALKEERERCAQLKAEVGTHAARAAAMAAVAAAADAALAQEQERARELEGAVRGRRVSQDMGSTVMAKAAAAAQEEVEELKSSSRKLREKIASQEAEIEQLQAAMAQGGHSADTLSTPTQAPDKAETRRAGGLFSRGLSSPPRNEAAELRKKVQLLEAELQRKVEALSTLESRIKDGDGKGATVPGDSSQKKNGPGERRLVLLAAGSAPSKKEDELKKKIKTLESEIKRLHAMVKNGEEDATSHQESLVLEVKRLQVANEKLAKGAGGLDMGTKELHEEVVRLMNANADLLRRERDAEKKRLQAQHLEEEVIRLQDANDELYRKFQLLKASDDQLAMAEKVSKLEIELNETLEANNMYRGQLKAALALSDNVSKAALGSIGDADTVLKELRQHKQKAMECETELEEMRELYTMLTLKCAEQEIERDKLGKELRTLRKTG